MKSIGRIVIIVAALFFILSLVLYGFFYYKKTSETKSKTIETLKASQNAVKKYNSSSGQQQYQASEHTLLISSKIPGVRALLINPGDLELKLQDIGLWNRTVYVPKVVGGKNEAAQITSVHFVISSQRDFEKTFSTLLSSSVLSNNQVSTAVFSQDDSLVLNVYVAERYLQSAPQIEVGAAVSKAIIFQILKILDLANKPVPEEFMNFGIKQLPFIKFEKI